MQIIIKKMWLIALAVIGIMTLITSPSISIPSLGNSSQIAIQGVLLFAKIVGCIAFIRGLLLLSKSKSVGFQESTSQRAYTHLCGGILAMNITLFLTVLEYKLKLGMFL